MQPRSASQPENPQPLHERFYRFILELQDKICRSLETFESSHSFREDAWQHPGGGGGRSRILEQGSVWEKAGVNISRVEGELPDSMKQTLGTAESRFLAEGISLVIHPRNPYVPTVHANFRYFELYDVEGTLKDRWFGGGSDLTPYYLDPADATHFHRSFKEACDRFDPDYYPRFKQQCDAYFVNRHRGMEARGIGGIFYDYLRPADEAAARTLLAFSEANGQAFLDAYLPIARRQADRPYGEREQFWQQYRRGRYVEFNLIHDRGTLFGLKTQGRIESILMSLPPVARWVYDYQPEAGSPEAELLEQLRPRDWI